MEPSRPDSSSVSSQPYFLCKLICIGLYQAVTDNVALFQAFNSARAIWHYPRDVSEISKEFKDIPQYCFPGKIVELRECQ